ncbi:MAG: hypothetical protein ACFCU7_18310 [Pleurocapsa sp.]
MMNSLTNLLSISMADARELGKQVDYDFSSNFSDGKSDGENNFEPIAYQWLNSDYRKGYLIGLARRIGIERAYIYGVEIAEIMSVTNTKDNQL